MVLPLHRIKTFTNYFSHFRREFKLTILNVDFDNKSSDKDSLAQ